MLIFYLFVVIVFSFILIGEIKTYKKTKSKLDLLGVIGNILILIGGVVLLVLNLIK